MALPFGSTVLRAISQSILKLGYGEVPSPVFASFVSTAVSLALLLAWFLASGRRIEGTRRDIGWLVLAGAVNALAIYLLNAALETGQLIMVSPIAAISPVFSLMIGLYFRTERIDWRKLAMLALVVPGVLVIVVGK